MGSPPSVPPSAPSLPPVVPIAPIVRPPAPSSLAPLAMPTPPPPPSAPPSGPRLPPPSSSPREAYERAFRAWSSSNLGDLADAPDDRSSGRLSYQIFTAADLPAYRPAVERLDPPRAKTMMARAGLALVAAMTIAFTAFVIAFAGDEPTPVRARSLAAAMPAVAVELPSTSPASPDVVTPASVELDELDVQAAAPPQAAATKPVAAKPRPRILVPKNPYDDL